MEIEANSEDCGPFGEDVSEYEKMVQIGRGTYGEVFKAKHRASKKIVALKKIFSGNEKNGLPMTAVREIYILKKLKHDNIVNLIQLCHQNEGSNTWKVPTVYLIMDFCQHDLAGLLKNKVKFSPGEVKCVIQQLLQGLFFIHENSILHRDIKPANILMTKDGVLKLADFGLARPYKKSTVLAESDSPPCYTPRVVTLWYRPPELLLGKKDYGPAVDIWSAGCIMGEMYAKAPLFPGQNDQHQLRLISGLCGSIDSNTFQGVDNLPIYQSMELPKNHKKKIRDRMKVYIKETSGVELLEKLLDLDPGKRITADEALCHNFFYSKPRPCRLKMTLSQYNSSMFSCIPVRPIHNPNSYCGPGPCKRQKLNDDDDDDDQYRDHIF